MRMRPQSPMLTMSDTAPIVQKFVLLPTAPNTSPSANPDQATMAPGLPMASMNSPPL
jgi:hypothetical protein